MIQIIHGDLLQCNATYICHQVNCMGVMGAGVAKQIKSLYPKVFFNYQNLCKQYENRPAQLLGSTQMIALSEISSTPCVVNLFGQVGYGRDSVQTNLPALQKACQKVADYADPEEIIAMPYRIGCGLAGGNWGDVMDMLTEVFKDKTLHLYKL